MERSEVEAVAVAHGALLAHRVAVPDVFDLDHLGAHVREEHRAEGTGKDARHIDDANAGELHDPYGVSSIVIACEGQRSAAFSAAARSSGGGESSRRITIPSSRWSKIFGALSTQWPAPMHFSTSTTTLNPLTIGLLAFLTTPRGGCARRRSACRP